MIKASVRVVDLELNEAGNFFFLYSVNVMEKEVLPC